MTLEDAIEIKRKYQWLLPKESYPELLEADNLLIEAGKKWREFRERSLTPSHYILPGETEE